MRDQNLTDEELIRAIDNDPDATPRERELTKRLWNAIQEGKGWYGMGKPNG